jgi:hypothetical protein
MYPTPLEPALSCETGEIKLLGYADGMRDGEQGRPKDHGGMLKHAKTWLFGNPTMDAYSAAYNRGHAAGLAERHGAYQPPDPTSAPQPPSPGGPSMPGGANIHATIQAHPPFRGTASLATCPGSTSGGDIR